MKSFRVIGSLAVLAVLGAACNDGRAPEEETRRATSAVVSGLPTRHFVQLPPTCVGDSFELDRFDYNSFDPASYDGTLVATLTGPGTFSMSVVESDQTVVPIAPSGLYVKPLTVTTHTHRAVCASVPTMIDRGEGPRGRVYSYDTQVPVPVTCWVNARGTSEWTQVVVATSQPGEPIDAFWPILGSPRTLADNGQSDNEIEIAYWRDAEFDPDNTIAEGRDAREHSYVRTITIGPGNALSVAPSQLPAGQSNEGPLLDWKLMAAATMTPTDCSTRCGNVWNGLEFIDCTQGDLDPTTKGCQSGEVCGDGERCQQTACTPKTVAEACVDGAAGTACGVRPDGCGGVIVCPSCSGEYACGASGNPNYCQKRALPMTITSIRAAYGDTLGELCGSFDDPETGLTTVMDTDCGAGRSCVDNLCTPVNRGAGPGVPTLSCPPPAPPEGSVPPPGGGGGAPPGGSVPPPGGGAPPGGSVPPPGAPPMGSGFGGPMP